MPGHIPVKLDLTTSDECRVTDMTLMMSKTMLHANYGHIVVVDDIEPITDYDGGHKLR